VQPMYVSALFTLLKSLDVEQRAVVRALRTSETQVSLWAHGKRPVPKAQARPFLLMVRRELAQIQAAADDARQHDDIVTGPTILTHPTPKAVRREMEARDCVERWAWEMADHSGEVNRRVQASGRVLGDLAHQDANKLTNPDLDRYMGALTEARRNLRVIASRRGVQLPSDPDFRGDWFWHDASAALVERFTAICRYFGVDLDAAVD
jgi:hypothetical protein